LIIYNYGRKNFSNIGFYGRNFSNLMAVKSVSCGENRAKLAGFKEHIF
jgi:hypothetical protein